MTQYLSLIHILSGFAAGTLTGQTCLYVGLGLAAAVLVQMLVHYLSDSLQSRCV